MIPKRSIITIKTFTLIIISIKLYFLTYFTAESRNFLIYYFDPNYTISFGVGGNIDTQSKKLS